MEKKNSLIKIEQRQKFLKNNLNNQMIVIKNNKSISNRIYNKNFSSRNNRIKINKNNNKRKRRRTMMRRRKKKKTMTMMMNLTRVKLALLLKFPQKEDSKDSEKNSEGELIKLCTKVLIMRQVGKLHGTLLISKDCPDKIVSE